MKQHGLSNFRTFYLMLCIVFYASILRGQTQFTGPANGDWFTVANWSNGLPAIGNNATIPGGASVVINAPLSTAFKIESFGTLTNNSTLTIGDTLFSGSLFTNTGSITANASARITSSGGLNNSGTLNNAGIITSNSLFTNSATGVLTNDGTISQLANFTNDGVVNNKTGVFSCFQLFNNNKTIKNLVGATFTLETGSTFTNAVGADISNAGTFKSFSTFTNNAVVTNLGLFQNNGIQTCNGTFNNLSGGSVDNPGTINLAGTWNNDGGATTTVGFKFIVFNFGKVQNIGTFQNNNLLQVQGGGIFNNLVGGLVNSFFGSMINNDGNVNVALGSTIMTNGQINNSNFFQNDGTIESNSGAKITNSDRFNITGLLKNVNIITNNSEMTLTGTIENNSGGAITNAGIFLISSTAKIFNNFEITNLLGSALRNDGLILNNLRLFNDGVFENNGTFTIVGDFFNRTTGVFNNNGITEVKTGALINQGQINNTKTLLNGSCSIVKNLAAINNTGGLFENRGILFQRGTVTGNAIVAAGGIIQTSATSDAPSVCIPSLNTGLDNIGEGKVYAQSLMNITLGLDTCVGFQYFVEDVNRKIYNCDQIGQTLTAHFRLLTRTGDSLTCTSQVTVTDNIQPTITNCPANLAATTLDTCSIVTWTEPTATDNCPNLKITVVSSPTSGLKNGSCFPVGKTTVTYNATDFNGFTATCNFTVTITKIDTCANDNVAPIISNCPSSQSLTTTDTCSLATWKTPTATDNCSTPSVTLASSPKAGLISGSCFPIGITTLTYKATDAKGNFSTCSFNVVVTKIDTCLNDAVKPVLSNCPTNQALSTTDTCKITTWTAPTATDNCSIPTITLASAPKAGLISGSCFPIGTTTLTYTATDAKGNFSTCSFNVIVTKVDTCANDVVAPKLVNCPVNQSLSTSGTCTNATWNAPTATDNCSTPSVTVASSPILGLNSGLCFPVGTTTIIYTAKDAKLNISSCSFTITVKAEPFQLDPNKCYKIVSKAGKVLDLDEDDFKDGTYINQTTYDNMVSQQWQFLKLTDGSFKIVNRFNGKLLVCQKTTNGSWVYQWENINNSAKYWKVEPVANGNFKIINVYSKKSLDLLNNSSEEDAPIGIWDYHGGNTQMWQIVEVPCQSTSNCVQYGSVTREVWYNQTDATFPIVIPTTIPNLTSIDTDLEGPHNIRDNYKTRVQGYFAPSVSGRYTFNITGDDNVELYISSNSSSKPLKQVAHIKGWTNPDEENKFASQTSKGIEFKKGKLYYFELRHKEFGGSDHYRVRWKLPNARPRDGFQIISSQFLARPCAGQVQGANTHQVFTFETKAEFNQAKLQWITNTGYQNDYFEVERLNAQSNFESLDKINANTGNDALKVFDFTDANPMEGDNYYRIKTVLLDGTPQYSEVKKVNFNHLGDVAIFPNPADEYINIDLKKYEGKSVNLYVYNQLGKLMQVVKVEKVNSTLQRLDTQSFTSGSYFIRVQASGVREVTKQFKIAN